MAKKKQGLKIKLSLKYFLYGFGVLVLLVLFLGLHYNYFTHRVYGGVFVNGQSVAFLGQEALLAKIEGMVLPRPKTITLTLDENTFMIDEAAIELAYDLEKTAHEAFTAKRRSTPVHTFFFTPFDINSKDIPIVYTYNSVKLDELVAVIAGQVEIAPVFPGVQKIDEQYIVEKGVVGKTLASSELKALVLQTFTDFAPEVKFATQASGYVLSQEEADFLAQRASKVFDKELRLTSDQNEFLYQGNALLAMLTVEMYSQSVLSKNIDEIALTVDRPFQNPVFDFADGRVVEFAPSKDGLLVQKEQLATLIAGALVALETSEEGSLSIAIPVAVTPPDYTTSEVNDLGIKELLGVGNSTYRGSIPSRIHNVAHATSKFNGVLIAPGNTFSFNETLGDVSALTGYQKAYVILDGATVLGDGGGVCQVSTTLFRASLAAGLPIVERRSHSYRVSYYEQDEPPGIDATVYSPTTDFKFKNDTPGHLLIQSRADSANTALVFEIYGTSDGRKSTVTKPIITSTSPAPEDLFIDDPNLPIGVVQQIDWKAPGAQVYFDYKVERDGQEIYSKRFNSNFRPWQAKFLRGTGTL